MTDTHTPLTLDEPEPHEQAPFDKVNVVLHCEHKVADEHVVHPIEQFEQVLVDVMK